MNKKPQGRPPKSPEERKVVIKTTVMRKHEEEGKKAIDKLSSDTDGMLAYANGKAILTTKTK